MQIPAYVSALFFPLFFAACSDTPSKEAQQLYEKLLIPVLMQNAQQRQAGYQQAREEMVKLERACNAPPAFMKEYDTRFQDTERQFLQARHSIPSLLDKHLTGEQMTMYVRYEDLKALYAAFPEDTLRLLKLINEPLRPAMKSAADFCIWGIKKANEYCGRSMGTEACMLAYKKTFPNERK